MLIIIQFIQMKKILAVSGGVDSVVMLHKMRNGPDAVVAHFDHGIRENSGEDAEFVRRLAEEYGLPFKLGVGKLGAGASEAVARKARWKFLFGLCGDDDKVYTAHHRDDIAETVVINLLRGTGWRGLAVLGENRRVSRPLIAMSKSEIYRYAGENELHFRQDQTNNEEDYLRNRVREKLRDIPREVVEKVADLANKQSEMEDEIEILGLGVFRQVARMGSVFRPGKIGLDGGLYRVDRRLLADHPKEISREVLRTVVSSSMRRSLTRKQLDKLLDDISSLQNGKRISFGKDYFIEITRDDAIFPILY